MKTIPIYCDDIHIGHSYITRLVSYKKHVSEKHAAEISLKLRKNQETQAGRVSNANLKKLLLYENDIKLQKLIMNSK